MIVLLVTNYILRSGVIYYMKVYLYINKKGYQQNTFRVAFKELVKIISKDTDSLQKYLVGKYEVKDSDNSYEVPYNKKYENRYFAIPITNRECGFFNLTTILCNNDLSDYAVTNEASLSSTIKTLMQDADKDKSQSISLDYINSRSKEYQNIINDISDSRFIIMINMINTWAKEQKSDMEVKLQIE